MRRKPGLLTGWERVERLEDQAREETRKAAEKVEENRVELEALRAFAAEALAASFEGGELDGGQVQDLAERLGLLAGHTVTAEEDAADRWDGLEEGDQVFAARWTVGDAPGWEPIPGTRKP